MAYFTQTSSTPYLFGQLIKDLVPDANNAKERLIKGCQVLVPETVFFKDGKIDFFSQVDRDYCLSFDLKTKLDSYLAVRTKLLEIVKDRKKDTDKHGKEQGLIERNRQAKF